MTFYSLQPFPLSLVWSESSTHRDLKLGPHYERWTTNQLSYPYPPNIWIFRTLTIWSLFISTTLSITFRLIMLVTLFTNECTSALCNSIHWIELSLFKKNWIEYNCTSYKTLCTLNVQYIDKPQYMNTHTNTFPFVVDYFGRLKKNIKKQ